ncbi:MAG: integrin alpha [Ignavibacteria bacterium]
MLLGLIVFGIESCKDGLYAMSNKGAGLSLDFKSAAKELKKEKSPLSLINKGGEKGNAIENGDWNYDSRRTLISAGFNPEEFRPQELFGDAGENGMLNPGDSLPIEATSVRTYTGMTTGEYFGNSVSNAGDVNGDGYDDIIVGAYIYSSSTGRVYIYYGGLTQHFNADIILTGEATDNYFGRCVSTAGDVNGDGYSDIIVGAYGYSSKYR